MDIAWVYQRDAAEITVRADEENKPDILQFRMDIPYDQKTDAMVKLMEGASDPGPISGDKPGDGQ